jgi:uncharacterized membrane protein (UPF0127 family)
MPPEWTKNGQTWPLTKESAFILIFIQKQSKTFIMKITSIVIDKETENVVFQILTLRPAFCYPSDSK